MFREQHRSEPRYQIRQSALVRFQGEQLGQVIETVAQNVSAHGVLLRCETLIPRRSKIEVTLRFPNALPLEAVGEVLRVEAPSAGGGFLIAVKCERPWGFSR